MFSLSGTRALSDGSVLSPGRDSLILGVPAGLPPDHPFFRMAENYSGNNGQAKPRLSFVPHFLSALQSKAGETPLSIGIPAASEQLHTFSKSSSSQPITTK